MFTFYLSYLHQKNLLTLQAEKKDGTKDIMEERKKCIQQRFLSEMALRVDFPKHGYGSSNDGNTARRFFENIEKSSEITGITCYPFYVLMKIS